MCCKHAISYVRLVLVFGLFGGCVPLLHRWSVIKEPEDLAHNEVDYRPCQELDFWANRASELQAILAQLQSPTSIKVIEALRLSHSTYCQPLSHAIEQVKQASLEACSNTVYLELLRPYLQAIDTQHAAFGSPAARGQPLQPGHAAQAAQGQVDEEEGVEEGEGMACASMSYGVSWARVLRPLMHMLYLISQHSPFYKSHKRIGFFVRLIENMTIHHARAFVYNGGGNEVFADDCVVSAARLEEAIGVCSCLKDLYLKYERQCNETSKTGGHAFGEGEGAWRRRSDSMFARLDSFVERCQDVLYLAKTAASFQAPTLASI